MIVTNSPNLPCHEIKEIVRLVRGNVVGTVAVSESLLGSLKKIFSSALSWGPKIVTGEDIGLPEEEEVQAEVAKEQEEKHLQEYSALLHELREKALARMVASAESYGADAVMNVRFDVNVIMMHAFEVCAYGTAVKLA